MRHTGMFHRRDEHLDLFPPSDGHGAGHTTGDTVRRAPSQAVARVLRGPDPHPARRPRWTPTSRDAPDAALAEGQGDAIPSPIVEVDNVEGLARRHRPRRARPRADLLHDDPRHLARPRRCGCSSRATSRRSCSSTIPGSRTRRRRISEKLAGAEDQVREFIGERAEAS
jgi:hypothetical protein